MSDVDIERLTQEIVLGWEALEAECEYRHLPAEDMAKMIRQKLHQYLGDKDDGIDPDKS